MTTDRLARIEAILASVAERQDRFQIQIEEGDRRLRESINDVVALIGLSISKRARTMPEPKSPIEIKLSAIDRTLEVHSVRMDAIDQKLDRIADLVEANTGQVATLSEGLTRLENSVNRLENIVERGFQNLDQRLDRLAALTERQSATAEALAQTVALLIQRTA